jgi:glycosyltransferase involved in cell wall biosynthesis
MTMPVKWSPQNTQQTRGKATIQDPGRHIPSHIALFMPSLGGGGVERVMLNLAGAFIERGSRVDLVVYRAEGPYQDRLPAQLNLVALRAALPGWARLLILAADPKGLQPLLRPVLLPLKGVKQFRYLPDLARYLRREHPQVLLSALTKPNLMAVWARRLAGAPTRLVISEHSTLSPNISLPRRKWKWRWRFFPSLGQRVYPGADAIIAVSNGVADDLAQSASIPRERITTIYNPIVSPTLLSQSKAPLDHPWFQPSAPPVVLGVGRLCEQKDFPTLLRAFARVRAQQEAHLMVLGEADAKRVKLRTDLMALATQLGIADDVVLPGFVANPLAYMARAAVFVLSSTWEGLPSVLIEALACGCPVVSTDCPSGPAEILENGKYGPLVPVGDDMALADAILSVLNTPPDRDQLRARSAMFTVDYAAEQYLEVLLGAI